MSRANALGFHAQAAGDKTLPLSASASPMAASDSALALSRKPHVLTTTASALS
jgi:hypothetical protein